MSSDVVIRAENLGKRYRIGQQQRYKSLRDSISESLKLPYRMLARGTNRRESTHIWALQGLSFEIQRGEVLGIIGRNGAGKSTLLKLLSRITKPSEGWARIRGRVGSLLEVGTGFHPELTGRENVYLNGAILGMKRQEVARSFDEIVAFAEIEQFLDTPVKHYSSGMYTRLAFAVAAHMQTEILLVDEVLAVGDAQFQKKCFARMQQVSTTGRTILFVSHNMAAMRRICTTGMVLSRGATVASGPIDQVVDSYLAGVSEPTDYACAETPSYIVERVAIKTLKSPVIKTFDPVQIRVTIRAKVDILDPGLYVGFLTLENERVSGLDFKDFETTGPIKAGEAAILGFDVESLPFLPGSYQLELHVKDMGHQKFEIVPQTYRFDVVDSPVYGGRRLDHWFGRIGLRARAVSTDLARDAGSLEMWAAADRTTI